MAGPGDEIAAGPAGHGHLRASNADREQVIDVLKAEFVQGRLTRDELDLRVGQALQSRTYAEQAAVVADLPAARMTAEQPGIRPRRTRSRAPGNARIGRRQPCMGRRRRDPVPIRLAACEALRAGRASRRRRPERFRLG